VGGMGGRAVNHFSQAGGMLSSFAEVRDRKGKGEGETRKKSIFVTVLLGAITFVIMLVYAVLLLFCVAVLRQSTPQDKRQREKEGRESLYHHACFAHMVGLEVSICRWRCQLRGAIGTSMGTKVVCSISKNEENQTSHPVSEGEREREKGKRHSEFR
jgi:hypothetical protein